eukprot:13823136-Alexandrium_andersonii.AAC.1
MLRSRKPTPRGRCCWRATTSPSPSGRSSSETPSARATSLSSPLGALRDASRLSPPMLRAMVNS